MLGGLGLLRNTREGRLSVGSGLWKGGAPLVPAPWIPGVPGMSVWAWLVGPHPNPLPRGEGEDVGA